MRALLRALYISLIVSLGFAFAQIEVKGIVLGDALGWEIEEVNMLLAIGEDSPVKLEIYSPGFDPDDYRAEWEGREELGDERYDQGQGEILGEFVLEQKGNIIAEGSYSVEHHRWEIFYEGDLAAGAYNLRTRFKGNAKNAYIYRLSVPDTQKASLSFAEGIELFDIRGRDWVKGFEVSLPIEAIPSRYALYDGDGAAELEAKVVMSDGSERKLDVSESLDWVIYEFDEPGTYQIYFRIPEDAYQYSNTVAFKELFPNPVTVEVVDEQGNALDFPYSLTGYSIRTTDLAIPEDYEFVRLEQNGGEQLDATQVRFGYEGGHVRYILRLIPVVVPPPAPVVIRPELTVEAFLVLPDGERPYTLMYELNGETKKLPDSGSFSYGLDAGDYSLDTSMIAGARIEGPSSVSLQNGDKKKVAFRVYPVVDLDLSVEPKLIPLGETFTVTTNATTLFPDLLPADLALILADSWIVNDPKNIIRPISSERTATVTLVATPTETGVFPVSSTLAPWNLVRIDEVTVVQPAALSLSKTTSTPDLRVGDTAEFTLTVTNTGDLTASDIQLSDTLPLGLEGENLSQSFSLEAQSSRSFSLSATVASTATDTIINTATMLYDGAEQSSSANINVLRPAPSLSRDLDFNMVVPGEQVNITLFVTNTGQDTLTYTLTDTAPEWLEPLAELSFSGELAPGETAEHSYQANVSFGSEITSEFLATLRTNAGDLTAPDTITRKLVPLEKTVRDSILLEGDSTVFTVRVTNPLNRALSLNLVESPDTGLGLIAPSLTELALEANEVRELNFDATPTTLGALVNEVSVFKGDIPAGYPADASLEVKPLLEPERISEVTLPFSIEAKTGDRLLIHHEVPAGSSYEIGSSRLDGLPIADPVFLMQDDVMNLYWQLPFEQDGVLMYTLRHRNELSALAEPSLSMKVENRELKLQGDHSFEELREAQSFAASLAEGIIKEPRNGDIFRLTDQTKVVIDITTEAKPILRLNGKIVDESYLGMLEYNQVTGIQHLEYFGLPLEIGRNLIEVNAASQSDSVEIFRSNNPTRLEIRPVVSATDGLTPVEFEIVALDDAGISSGFGAVTIDTNLEPLDEDAFPDISGYQVLMEEGVASLRLRPISSAQRAVVKAGFNTLESELESYLGGIQETLYSYQGSITFSYNFAKSNWGVSGDAKGYLETPIADGTLQVALDASADVKPDGDDADDLLDINLENGLAPQVESYDRFPLTGSAQDASRALESEDYIAARYDDANFSVGYYSGSIDLPGLSLPAQLTAFQAELRLKPSLQSQLTAASYVALAPNGEVTETITPDGTRLYILQNAGAIKEKTETLTVIHGVKREVLQRLRDYSINYRTGTILLTDPLYSSDPAFPNEPVSLEVSYTLTETPRTLWTYGAGVSYQIEGWQFAASGAEYNGLNIGAFASYTGSGVSFKTSYSYDPQTFSQVALDAALTQGALNASISLGYATELQGQGRLAYDLSENSTLALEHSASSTRNQTNTLYEHSFAPLTFGVGFAYLWEAMDFSALGRVAYADERLGLGLTHSQPFSNRSQALSDFRLSYKLDENLSAEMTLDYFWGNRFGGSIGLVQTLGSGSFAVSYQLPATDGTGNLARFGIDSPFALSDNWFLDTSAAYDQNFNDGSSKAQAGLGVRYQDDNLKATLGSEISYDSAQDDPFKVVFRSGISGQLDHQQVLSFDANYQVIPETTGDFTVAYALRGRDLSLLTYHTLNTGTENSLEGEIAPTLHFDTNWQLRPAFAYRLDLDTSLANSYLFSLGGHYYIIERRFGLGAGVHHQIQPGSDSSATAISLEGSLKVVEDLWVVAGYTLNGFDSLSTLTNNGLYIRLELFGGSE